MFDFLLAVAVTAGCAVVTGSEGGEAQLMSYVLTSSLLLRRSHPMIALGVASVASLGLAFSLPSPSLSIVVVPMIVYAVARYGKPGGGTAALWIGLAGAVIGPARWTGISGTNALAFAVTATACAAIVAGAYLLGRRLRERLEEPSSRAGRRPSADGSRSRSRSSGPAPSRSTSGTGSPGSCTTSWRTRCR